VVFIGGYGLRLIPPIALLVPPIALRAGPDSCGFGFIYSRFVDVVCANPCD